MTDETLTETGERMRLTEYFLGRLPEPELCQIEARYFADDDFFVFASGCEQELIRNYLVKGLSAKDVRSFEQKYLTSSGLREKVELSAAIMTVTRSLPVVDASATPRHIPVWRMAVAATLLCAIGLAAIQQIRLNRIEFRLRDLQALNSSPAAKTVPEVVLSFALRAGLDRDTQAGPVILRIPPEAKRIQILLDVGSANAAPEYRAALMLPDGAEVWSSFATRTSHLVAVDLPTSVLPVGDYVFTLDARGGTDHETYSFRVERKVASAQ